MAGRKPKPTAMKKLEGNPGKRKLNTKEPMPEKGMPDCPRWLLSEAKEERGFDDVDVEKIVKLHKSISDVRVREVALKQLELLTKI